MTGKRQSWEVAGNRLSLLIEGPERLEALITLIDGAERTLRLLFYIYAADDTGTRVRDALDRAVRRGVAVTLIIDAFGSTADIVFFSTLARDGATVCRFRPRYGRRYLLRNHQKLALADEAQVMIGGFNIEDDYFGTASDQAWRDLGLLVEGPAAARLVGYYDALAGWTVRRSVRSKPLRGALDRWSEPAGSVRWLLGGPARRLSPWALSVKDDMAASRRVDMVAAYFAPNPRMLRRLEGVAETGAARVLTAAKSDNNATIGAARHCYKRLLRRGVRVFEYQPTKLHTKLFVIDDVVHIGSANFDMRSLYLNLELMLRVEDAAFAEALRAYFEGELTRSTEITRETHQARSGVIERIRWSLAYFVVAVLDYGVTRRLNLGIEAD